MSIDQIGHGLNFTLNQYGHGVTVPVSFALRFGIKPFQALWSLH
jgi:hypothetical protein